MSGSEDAGDSEEDRQDINNAIYTRFFRSFMQKLECINSFLRAGAAILFVHFSGPWKITYFRIF